jgi:hypothetical protein
MTSITDIQCVGWHPTKHESYFTPKDGTIPKWKEHFMTNAKQYKEASIQLSIIKKTIKMICKGDSQIFQVKCNTAQFRLNDHELCSHHKKLFQKDTYKTNLTDVLVRSMPFKFIDGLKQNSWAILDKGWMSKLKILLQKADSRAIKILIWSG